MSWQPRHGGWDWDRDILPIVNWCLDNHIKVVLDDAWEVGSVWIKARDKLLNRIWPFLLENNIKILANDPPLYDEYVFDTRDDDTFKIRA